MTYSWTINKADAGKRLDVFLATHLKDKTRSSIAKLLKQGAGKVNGKPASVHQFLKVGDGVELDTSPTSYVLRPTSGHRTQDLGPVNNVMIVEETLDYLVINKPAGLIVHPDTIHRTGTLVDWLVEKYPRVAKIGEDPTRPGIVHRLDKDVSGLMVIAKTQAAFDDLKKQFTEHSTEKKYLALVHGEVSKDEGDIRFRIARSKTKARMAARPESEAEGRAAWTHYKVLQRFRGATLIELNILSGRTHQIRAHLLALRHPVIGDALYTLKQPTRRVAATRLLLQAVHLAFTDPVTGERKTFELSPDPVFEQVIKTFKPHVPKKI